MKREVGQRIRVKEDLIPGKQYNGVLFNRHMDDYKGMEGNITAIDEGWVTTRYSIDIDGGSWHWSEDMLEDAKSYKYAASLKDLQMELWLRFRSTGSFVYNGKPVNQMSMEQLEAAIADLMDKKANNES